MILAFYATVELIDSGVSRVKTRVLFSTVSLSFFLSFFNLTRRELSLLIFAVVRFLFFRVCVYIAEEIPEGRKEM